MDTVLKKFGSWKPLEYSVKPAGMFKLLYKLSKRPVDQ